MRALACSAPSVRTAAPPPTSRPREPGRASSREIAGACQARVPGVPPALLASRVASYWRPSTRKHTYARTGEGGQGRDRIRGAPRSCCSHSVAPSTDLSAHAEMQHCGAWPARDRAWIARAELLHDATRPDHGGAFDSDGMNTLTAHRRVVLSPPPQAPSA